MKLTDASWVWMFKYWDGDGGRACGAAAPERRQRRPGMNGVIAIQAKAAEAASAAARWSALRRYGSITCDSERASGA